MQVNNNIEITPETNIEYELVLSIFTDRMLAEMDKMEYVNRKTMIDDGYRILVQYLNHVKDGKKNSLDRRYQYCRLDEMIYGSHEHCRHCPRNNRLGICSKDMLRWCK